MTAFDYLKKVAETIATHGHRDNVYFNRACGKANAVVLDLARQRQGDPQAEEHNEFSLFQSAQRCAQLIKDGLEEYKPGSKWFEAVVAVEYVTLVAQFNTVQQATAAAV